MKHTYQVTKDKNVLVDSKYVIETNPYLSYYKRERQAYSIIDYILEDEEENLKSYLDDLGENVCCICGNEYVGWGNNAQPVKDGRCCDSCNATIIIPARINALHKVNNAV